MQRKVVKGSMKLVKAIEKLARPRRTPWMTLPAARSVNALIMAFMALLLALPFPPLPPFTNSLPCYSLILLAASVMEEDGILIWISYLVCAGTIVYLVVIAGALVAAFERIGQAVLPHFQ
jgi:hypothetical protein